MYACVAIIYTTNRRRRRRRRRRVVRRQLYNFELRSLCRLLCQK